MIPKITAFLIAVLLLFASCAPAEETEKHPESSVESVAQEISETKMGRYLETSVQIPPEITGFTACYRDAEHNWNFYASCSSEETAWYFQNYRLEQNKLVKSDIPWQDQINPEWRIRDICNTQDNGLYVLCGESTPGTFHVLKIVNGEVTEIALPADNSPVTNPASVFRAPNGILLGGQMGITYYADDGMALDFPGSSKFCLMGDTLLVSSFMDGVIQYDLKTGDEIKKIPSILEPGKAATISASPDGQIYAISDKGVFLFDDQEMNWREFVNSELYEMSSPDLSFDQFLMNSDGSFTVTGRIDDSTGYGTLALYTYEYSESVPSNPEKQLRVFSLLPSDLLRKGAVEMQKGSPDYQVRLDVFYPDKKRVSDTELSDSLKVVNTELLAGKGADVYLLDHLPFWSYEEKGALLDLSDTISELESGLLMNVAGSLQTGEELTVIPLRFSVPVIWGNSELISSVKSLAHLPQWAEPHAEKTLFYSMDSVSLYRRLYDVCSGTWLDGNGKLEEQQLAEFLENTAALSDSPESEELKNLLDPNDDYGLYMDISHAAYLEVSNIFDVCKMLAVLREKGGSYSSMIGQQESVFLPKQLIGVNRNSADLEASKTFIQVMLSEKVQDLASYDGSNGLAVNRLSLEKSVLPEQAQREEFIGGTSFIPNGMEGDPVDFDFEWMTEDEGNAFVDFCRNLKNPSIRDETFYDIILEYSKGYFRKEADLTETIRLINENTQAYLNE